MILNYGVCIHSTLQWSPFSRPVFGEQITYEDILRTLNISKALPQLIGGAIDYLEPWTLPITQLPSGLREIRFRIYDVTSGWYDSDRGEKALKDLGELMQRAAEAAPNARMTVTSTKQEPLPPKCQLAVEAALERMQMQNSCHRKLSMPSPS